jgi:tetratricopeptide (TPR) repeat protein
LEKAIEIKRRAQRCVQNGDLDGALSEYEKLIAVDDTDPYNHVLVADLLYKKGDQHTAGIRYLSAAGAYEKAGLYKNAIAVCKKLMRLSLAPVQVYQRLGALHALDGLATEASLYYMQHAEALVRDNMNAEAAKSLRLAFDASKENVKALDRLAEVQILEGQNADAVATLLEAAGEYARAGDPQAAERCRKRAHQLDPSAGGDDAPAGSRAPAQLAVARPAAESAASQAGGDSMRIPSIESRNRPPAGIPAVEEGQGNRPREATDPSIAHGFDFGVTAPESTNGVESSDAPPRLETDATFDSPSDVQYERIELEPSRAAGPPRLDDAEEAPAAETDEPEQEAPLAAVSRTSPESPGLHFDAPAPPPANPLAEVERLLTRAQECFRAGQREAASEALAGAANAYDALGRHDSAATIYRSLGKSAHASIEILEQWLRNCEQRGDKAEAAQVACELGDRALNDGDTATAQRSFERARQLDPANDVPARRLQRLTGAPPAAAPSTAPPKAAPAPVARVAAPQTMPLGAPREAAPARPHPVEAKNGTDGEVGRVEVAVGRGEAVTFDLGSLISEFQRGVEAQLSGDAQSHYDLAMSYREMGLLEQAVDSFRVAAEDPAYLSRASEMIGRCMLDQGRFDDAAMEFANAVSQPDVDSHAQVGLRFQLGLAHEAAGRGREALEEFERVYALQNNYPDVALKIRVLRKTLESA